MSKYSATIRLPLSDEAACAPADFAAARVAKRRLVEELRRRAEAGEPVQPEDLLPRWPTDPQDDPDVASLLFEDYRQRLRRGEAPSADDYEDRFPGHKDSLAQLVRGHSLLRSLGGASGSGVTLRLPAVGEELFGFRLRGELGRGAFARVFLAEQGELADRPVVLKVSGTTGHEPQTLAQLQHTHIVPIYSVHEDRAAGLRAVCMPFFGGASLSRVLEAVWNTGTPPTRGAQLVHALELVQTPAPVPAPEPPVGQEQGPGALELLGGLSYAAAAAWVVTRLAEALQHAHQRGVLHRDVKPSNVLLSADGEPMLLDFNLAQDAAHRRAQATLGGTVAYMAPEHLRAVAARDPVLARQVDHRADVYSLGMVLFEMLTGHSPFDQSASYFPLPVLIEAMAVERGRATPSLRARRPDAPWALESIVRKCLAPDAAQRYQQAEHLAEDLRRFLDDRPLKYAPELSRVERVQKWLRRNPRATSSGTMATLAAVLLLAVVGAAGAVVAGVREHLASTQDHLDAAEAHQRKRAYEDGTVRALCLVNTTVDVKDHVRQGQEVCEQTLALYGILDRDDWQEHPGWRWLSADDRRRLAEDTRELLLLLAWARVRTAPGSPEALRGAVALLDRAEAIVGLAPSPALWKDRAFYLARLGDAEGARQAEDAAQRTPPAGARDRYLLATAYARGGDRARAVAELDQAIAREPRHYWSWVQRGICYQEQKEYALAAADFGACVGLWPEFAWGHFNRGNALNLMGRPAEAVADYSAALERDPDFVLAYLNRGLAHLLLKQPEAALADFDRTLALGRDDAAVQAGRGQALEALGRHAEADAAFAQALTAAEAGDDEGRTMVRLTYALAVSPRLPGKARQAFADVLRKRPDHPQALYGLATLLLADRDDDEALACFNRALLSDPNFVEAHRFRAILLARRGAFDAAAADVNWCLDRDGRDGATLYAAACVSAWLAAKFGERPEGEAAANQALGFLQAALAQGYGRDKADADPDLAGIHDHPRFKHVLAAK